VGERQYSADMINRPDDGVAVEAFYRGTSMALNRWRCVAGESGCTGVLRHAWYVISFTHSGTFVLHARGRAETIDATRAMVLRPGEPVSMSRCHGAVAYGSAVAVHPDLFETIFPNGSAALTRSGTRAGAFLLQHLLLRMVRAARHEDRRAVDRAAIWIAGQTILSPGSDTTAAPREKRRDTILGVQAMLAANCTRPLQLAEIARAVNRSPFHLSRVFKRDTGLPMHSYLNRLRVRGALDQLIGRQSSVSELAHESGYSSHSHFTEAFRQEFGLAPTEVRRMSRIASVDEMHGALSSMS